MKLIIDVNEQTYKDIKNYREIFDGQIHILTKSIINGTPLPDNATNGDVIKSLFPDSELHKESDYISLTFKKGVEIVAYIEDRGASWWFAPYKENK